MRVEATPDIFIKIAEMNCTFLFAPNQIMEEEVVWIPMFINIIDFERYFDGEKDNIIMIEDVLKMPFGFFVDHEIILPAHINC